MRRDDLYFILNPALGIIKIGIAGDVQQRRQQLEHGCGVPLEVIRVVTEGCELERPLHEAFGRDRLFGEWFTPSADLVALAFGEEIIDDYLKRVAPVTAQWVKEHEAAAAQRKAEQLEAARLAREEAARIKQQEKKLAEQRKKAIAEARRIAAAKREEQTEKRRKEAEDMRRQWAARDFDLAGRLIKSDAAQLARQRIEEITTQRSRNAAMLGVSPELNPYETQRSANLGAPEVA